MDQRWFGVRCLFRHGGGHYEERITVWPARTLDDAIQQAEEEAGEYVDGLDCEYVGLAQAYGPVMTRAIDEARSLEAGIEVFSLIRDSELAPRDYIDRFFDTGAERQRDVGEGK
jgi:hypothetical protein